MFEDVDTPPTTGARKPGPGRPRKTPTKVVPTSMPDAQLLDALSQNLVFLSMGVGLFDKPCAERKLVHPEHESCSEAIANQAVVVASSLVEASKKNPALRKVLMMIVTTSVFGQVASAMLPVLMTVARNHVPAFQVALPDDGLDDQDRFIQMHGMGV